jgi:mRNA-degrading endonuclease RelE of RelBE toxin-antitoxin system
MKRVLFRPQAARDLERLPNRDRDPVEAAIFHDPPPPMSAGWQWNLLLH